jgi:4-amino-4-deoxy-L-arabinose transferase-like glycosyltransferase
LSQTETIAAETPSQDRRYAVLVAATVVLALVLRAWALYVRAALDYDETYYYLLGKSLFDGKGYMLNGLPHTAFPPLYPIFCGLTGLVSSTPLFCTALISVIAGALLPIPVYFLAKDMYNRRVGVMAAALTAVWPTLWFFAVRNIPYPMRMYCGSEPLFITLFIAGLLYLWLAARRDTIWHGALAGALIGLSVLARNEATVMFAFLFVWFVVDRFLYSALPRRAQAVQAAVVAVAFVIAVSPWVIYVHSVSGKWGMGSKLSNLTRTRPGLYNWIQKGISVGYVKIHYELNADATQFEDDYWGVTDWHKHHKSTAGGVKAALKLVTHPDGRWLPVLWHIFTDNLPPLVPRYIWPVLLLGVVLPPSKFSWNRGALLYATLIFVLVLQAVVIYAIARFQLPILPLFAILAARGLDAVCRGAAFVTGILTKRLFLEPAGYAVVAAAAMGLMIWGGVWLNSELPKMIHMHGSISSNKYDAELSSALKTALPPGSSVMCNKPWIPLYAGLQWRASPFGASERLAKYAISQRIDFAILGTWQMPKVQPGMGLYPYLVRKITLSDGEETYLFDFRRAWHASAGS